MCIQSYVNVGAPMISTPTVPNGVRCQMRVSETGAIGAEEETCHTSCTQIPTTNRAQSSRRNRVKEKGVGEHTACFTHQTKPGFNVLRIRMHLNGLGFAQ